MNTLVKEFTCGEVEAEKIKLTITPKSTGVKVYVGDAEYTSGSEIVLADYAEGSNVTIPIKLLHEESNMENSYTLKLTIPEQSGVTGYIEDLRFIAGPNTTMCQDVPGFEFDQATTEYHITLTDGQFNVPYTLSEAGTALGKDLWFKVYYNDVMYTGNGGSGRLTQVLNGQFYYLSQNIPMGTTGKFSIEVGTITEDTNGDGYKNRNDEFTVSDRYDFYITKVPGLASLSVTDSEDAAIEVTPNTYLDEMNTLVKEFTCGEVEAEKIKLTITPKSTGVKVYVGDAEYTSGSEIVLADYAEGSNVTIPIKLLHEESNMENSYTLKLTIVSNYPVINNQSTDIICDKNDVVTLTVDAYSPTGSELTYQWYLYVSDSQKWPIEGATSASFNPDTSIGNYNAENGSDDSYICVVSTVVGGKVYSVQTDPIYVGIRLTYLNPPSIIDDFGVYAGSSVGYRPNTTPYKSEYKDGETPDAIYMALKFGENTSIGNASHQRDFKLDIQIFHNTIQSYEGAELVSSSASNATSNGSARDDNGVRYNYYVYSTSLNASYSEGEHYFFAVVTLHQDSDNPQLDPVSIKTGIVKMTFSARNLELEGEGTEQNPFLIRNTDEMVIFRDLVNSGEGFQNCYVRMENDITLPSDWTPVGSSRDNPFKGIFDGNNKTLTVPSGGLPLFGHVYGAEVHDLSVLGEKIAGYGLVNNFEGVGLSGSAIIIDNVTLKSGTQTLKSGLIGANITTNGYAGCSAGFVATIRNCTIEEGVVIGYNKDQTIIGSFAGRMQGTIENCTSYATVYGKNYVGGIIGSRDNAMGTCTVSNCSFYGTVEASGNHAGGIVGGGYCDLSAPNGIRITVLNCTASGTVIGADKVGGILGGDSFVAQGWNSYSFRGNTFTGTVKATNGSYVGGIIGYYHSLNKFDDIANNYYSATCGADKGIGYVWLVDTNAANPTVVSGTTYVNTADGTDECPTVEWCSWKEEHNRTDDPLGADADKLTMKLGSTSATMESIAVSGYKTNYTKGEAFTLEGATVTVTWSDGTTTHPAVSELTVEGYNANTLGEQTVTLKYENLTYEVKVTVTEETVTTPTMTGLTVSGIQKTTYVAGQQLDLTGATYTVTMSDGSTGVLSDSEAAKVTVSGYQADKVGIQTVVLTYESVSTTVQITVIPKTISSLSLSGRYKTEYLVDEKLDLTGMVITANWNDGSKTTVAAKDVTATGYDATKLGEQTITLTYQGISTTFTVTVSRPAGEITVYFTLLGDSKHGSSGTVHTHKDGNLTTWISKTSFTVSNNATVKDVLEMALTAKGYSWSNPSGNYVSAINGLAEFDNGSLSGWMYTLNGAYPELGVAEQYLNNGDTIIFHYTDDYTVERHGFNEDDDDDKEDAAVKEVIEKIDAIGTVSYTNASKQKIDAARKAYDALTYAQKQEVTNYSKLQAAEKAYADLKKADDQKKADAVEALIDKIDAEVTLDSEAEIVAARTAYNKLTADQKALVENYKELTDAETALAELKADEDDKKKAQEIIDMIDKLGTITLESEEAVKAARAAYDKLTDVQKALVTNYDKLEAAEKKLAELKDIEPALDVYKITGDYLENLGDPEVGSIGGEWMVIGLIRSDREVPDSYYEKVLAYVKENADENGRLHANKSTENARIIIALTAIGKDATNVDGIDLIAGLNSMEYIQKQGINGPIWALIALDSGNYPVPAGGDVTRDALIQVILDAQLADGGWAIAGSNADADMTGMALQALAPYYGSNANVKAAVDKGITTLSEMQHADGGYGSVDGPSSESISQVIVALTALGIDPHTDSRFIKNGSSAVDALLTYFVEGGGFKHILAGELNGMATEQSYYALTAYNRFLEGKTSLYDMTDVLNKGSDVEIPAEPDATEPDATVPSVTEPGDVDDGDKGGFPWWIVIVVIVLGAAVAIVIVVKRKGKYSAV